ncbi:MAG TPA: fumarylacetoacetate hydrolase family protein [Ktedonobacterales bacterium]|jgi:fumarylacetoacetate (FAA) hydrolase|nr:fumarylacetoacetate hydrolase family protein [Ktedonobacterales bacterium]
MKFVTYVPSGAAKERAGLLLGDAILDLAALGAWAARNGVSLPDIGDASGLPTTVLELLQLGDLGMQGARSALAMAERARPEDLREESDLYYPNAEVALRTPVPNPPTIRDFYAFEQHVKAARAKRGVGMIPEWYEIAVFYFSNTAALFGTDEPIPYPRLSNELDFELEMACVIGREGQDISADEAPGYIAGYMVMNDWSARDLQRHEMKMNLGPAKGKDFATSLGPWLVTPDELEDRRIGSRKDERFDLAMTGRINGDQLTSDNYKTIYFTFPQMIERASQHVRLRPGDILGSGTCGTGCILELGTERHRWLQPGHVVEMEIERLGVLRNTIVE